MTLADLNVRVGFLNDLKKGLGGIERDLRRASSNFAKAGNEISMSLSLPLAAFGVKAVQTAAQMESLKLAMRTTFQDAGRSIEGADKELENLRKSALAPGLDFEQAVKASIRLQNIGMSAENARKTIEQLANAISMSGGTAEDLDGVTIQMAQMISKGKVLAQDLRIIQERMPKITSLMQAAFGVKTADALQEMGVSGEEFVRKITAEMEKLPRVSGGLANSIVNMGAAVKSFLATIGDDIAETFSLKTKFEQFGSWLQGVATWFKGLSASTKEWILYVGAAVIALGPLLKVMAGVSALGAQMVGGFAKLLQGISWVTGGALNLTKAFTALSAAQKATVIGLAIAAFAAMVVVVDQLNDGLTQAGRTQKMLNDVQLEAAQSIVKERLEAERNIAIINDGTKSKDEQRAAMQRLIDTGSEYFKGLSIEKSSVLDITAAYDKYIANLLTAAKAKAAQEKIIELEKKRLDIYEKIGEQSERAMSSPLGGIINTAVNNIDGSLKSQLESIDAQQKALAKLSAQQEAMQGKSSTNVVAASTSTPSTGSQGNKKKGENTKSTATVLQELEKAYASADVRAQAFGSTFDANSEKASALQTAITTLLDMGLKPTDAAVAPLVERYKNLNSELTLLPTTMAGVTSMTAPLLETTTQLTNAATQVGTAFNAMGVAMQDALMGASESMKAMAASGETSFAALGKAALKGAADVLRAKIIEGVAAVVADSLEKFGVLGLAIAGGAGAAAGVLFNKVIKGLKIPAFADGATVDSPTMAMFGEYPSAGWNPEHALRTDQLQGLLNKAASQGGGGNMTVTGTLRGNGRELLAVLEQASIDKMRRGG